MWSFLPVSLPLGPLQPFQCNWFLTSVDKLSFTKFLAEFLGTQTMVVSTFPWSALSSIAPFLFDLNFTSNIITFCFFTARSPLLANSLSVVHFCKLSCGFVTERETGRQHNYTVCCQCMTWRKYVHWIIMDRLKDEMWLVTDQNAHLLF